MFEGQEGVNQDESCTALLQGLPLVYFNLEQQQKENLTFKDQMEVLHHKEAAAGKFQVHNGPLCYRIKATEAWRYVVPQLLKLLLLK